MNKGKKYKVIQFFKNTLITALVTIAAFLIVERPVKTYIDTEPLREEVTENKFVPNDSTWYHMGDETLYVDGYTPYEEMFVNGSFDSEKYSTSFTYNDSDGLHKPKKPQSYQLWFQEYAGDGGGFGHGGGEHSIEFSFDLLQPGMNEVGVEYYVEEIKFDTMDLYWAYGKIKQISLDIGGDLLDFIKFVINNNDPEILDNIARKILFEIIFMLLDWWWPNEAPKWWIEAGFEKDDWPEHLPNDIQQIIEMLNKLEDVADASGSDLGEILSDFIDSLNILQEIANIVSDGFINWLEDYIVSWITKFIVKQIMHFLEHLFPGIGWALAIFNSLFSLGLNWKETESLITSLANGTNGNLNSSEHAFMEDGVLHLKPTSYGNDPLEWETLFTFDDNYFHEDDAHKNDENIRLEYSWREKGDIVNFRIQGINDWKTTIGLGGHWTFVNAIQIDYWEKAVLEDSYYSFNNDMFGDYNNQNEYYHIVQDAMFDANYDTGTYFLPTGDWGNERPFFTKENTYKDLEDYIKINNIMKSRDRVQEISGDDYDILFYDDKGEIIEENEPIDGAMIKFKLVSNGTNKEVKGETDYLVFEIPYINIDNIRVEKDILDYDEYANVPFDNESTYSWVYNPIDELWTLNTNEKITFDLDYANGVRDVQVKYLDEFYNINQKLTPTDSTIRDISVPINQSQNNELTKREKVEVSLMDKETNSFEEARGVRFDIVYNSLPSFDDLVVTNTGGKALDKEIRVLDTGNISKYTLPNEIYDTVVTQEDVVAKSEFGVDLYKFVGGKWEYQSSSNEVNIEEDGIWGVSTINEFGNNSFVVIDKTSSKGTPITTEWVDSKEYIRDMEYYLEQDNSEQSIYEDYSAAEYRKINLMINSGELPNLQIALAKNPIDNNKLSKVTNAFEDGVASFNEEQIYNHEPMSMREALEAELTNQLEIRGIDDHLYEIHWLNVTDSTLMENSIGTIKYEIVPKGYWHSIGEYQGEFALYQYKSIEEMEIDTDTLEYITNGYASGTKFNEEVLNFHGATNSMKNELTTEILGQLFDFGVDEKYLDKISIEWGVEDDQVIETFDQITFIITSEAPMIKGEKRGRITSSTRVELSGLYIDTSELSKVTNTYFNGTVFGGNYDEYGVEGNMKEDLEDEVYKQLESQGVGRNQVDVSFYDEDNNLLSDHVLIENGMSLFYKVIPKGNMYYGELSGSFSVMTFDTLDKLSIPIVRLMMITNNYESGIKFSEVKLELDEYIEGFLLKKGLNQEYIDVDWSVDDTDDLNCKDLITLDITSNDETYIRGEAMDTFIAIPYFNLSTFKLNKEPLEEEILVNTNEVFYNVRPTLEQEINSQLEEQGFDTSLISISWDIGDEETLIKDKDINLYIDGYLELLVHEDLSYGFQTEQGFKNKVMSNYKKWVLIGLLILLLILAIIVFNSIRNRISRRRDDDDDE